MARDTVVSPLFSAEIEFGEVSGRAEANHESATNSKDLSRMGGYKTVTDSGINVHPESQQCTFFKPLLLWIYPLIRTAQEGQITEDDIWETPSDCEVKRNADALKYEFEQLKNCEVQDEGSATCSGLQSKIRSSVRSMMPPFGWSILFAFKQCIITSGFYHVCFAILQLTLPFLIGELLEYISTGKGGMEQGFGLVVALAVASTASSYCIITTFYHMRRGALQIKAATMMNVYQHALQLTKQSRQKCSVGQTTNLMSIDADKIAIGLQFIHFIWHGPVAVVIVMIILSFEVGAVASVAGLSFLFLLMPLQRYIAKKIGRFRRLMIGKTDQRVKLTNEILQVIRAIKYYHWEESMYARIQDVRALEMDQLFTYLVVNGLLREMMFLSVPLAAFFIFSIYVYAEGRSMSVVQVFRVIAYLNTLRFPTHLFSQALKYLSDGSVSVRRIDDFFSLSTLSLIIEFDNDRSIQGYHRVSHRKKGACLRCGGDISISNAFFSWNHGVINVGGTAESTATVYNPISDGAADTILPGNVFSDSSSQLQRITLSIQDGELVAIIGAVGAGKSSLMSAMLGEMTCCEGSCIITGDIAYCAQTPWIQNMTLRDNVLFGQEFHGVVSKLDLVSTDQCSQKVRLYCEALYNAALLPDLEILPMGDLTEIGERGINLSGGQKARVSLARALMAAPRSDIVFLDDPFSAVDGHTGEGMFFNGVVDGLKKKLRVVVMNSHMQLIRHFDKVIMMENGRIVAVDTPAALSVSSKYGTLFAKMTGVASDHAMEDSVSSEDTDAYRFDSLEKRQALRSEVVETFMEHVLKKINPKVNATTAVAVENDGRLILKEGREKGNIDHSVYIAYFSACLWKIKATIDGRDGASKAMLNTTGFVVGLVLCILLILLFGAAQVARIAVDLLLVAWAQEQTPSNFRTYVIVLLALLFLILLRMFSLNGQAVRSSKNMHNYIFQCVVAAPIPTFFDTHTVGEVLNRFAKDLEVVDSSIPEFFLQFMTNWYQIGAIFVLCVWSTPYFLIFLAPMSYAFYKVYVNFACVQRDLKRLESVSRTPVYSSFSEALNGLDTIRAYGDSERFIYNHLSRMNRLQKVSFHSQMAMTYVTARLELMVAMVMFAVALCAVVVRDSVSQVGVGMALVYTLQLTAMFQRCVQLTIDLQGYFTSAERLLSYATIPQEISQRSVDTRTEDTSKWNSWPDKGEIEFSNVNMRYRENDLVLRKLSFKINGGSRVGVCGRTGAGKSSIMIALFRIVEIEEGLISIDGRDTGSTPLSVLRSRLAIIPQDPVLFSGNIRFQLDPFDEYSDVEIWEALDQVYMSESVRNMSGGLNASIAENGDNLSQGQRQLLCISRALLRKNKILIMDEATSAVDPHTDCCIQKLLRSSVLSSGCTVLTIAHRLQTIADYDYVLVMDKGGVAEYGSPQELLKDDSSLFCRMYNSKSIEGGELNC